MNTESTGAIVHVLWERFRAAWTSMGWQVPTGVSSGVPLGWEQWVVNVTGMVCHALEVEVSGAWSLPPRTHALIGPALAKMGCQGIILSFFSDDLQQDALVVLDGFSGVPDGGAWMQIHLEDGRKLVIANIREPAWGDAIAAGDLEALCSLGEVPAS